MNDLQGNAVYLVCTACGNAQNDALRLAERSPLEYKANTNTVPFLNKWFQRHAKCGGTVDHFRLALRSTENWDMPKPDKLEAAVLSGLLNGSH